MTHQCGLCKHATASGAGKMVSSGFLVCKKLQKFAGETVSAIYFRECSDYLAETDEEALVVRVRFMERGRNE